MPGCVTCGAQMCDVWCLPRRQLRRATSVSCSAASALGLRRTCRAWPTNPMCTQSRLVRCRRRRPASRQSCAPSCQVRRNARRETVDISWVAALGGGTWETAGCFEENGGRCTECGGWGLLWRN
eukprot:260941-Chlamydomonas_euryale.AAC.2